MKERKYVVKIDIEKALNNAYKRQEERRLYDDNNVLRELFVKLNPQTMIDRTIKDYSIK